MSRTRRSLNVLGHKPIWLLGLLCTVGLGQIGAVYTTLPSSSPWPGPATLRADIGTLATCASPNAATAPNYDLLYNIQSAPPFSPPAERTTDGGFGIDQPNNISYWCDGAYIYATTNTKGIYNYTPSPRLISIYPGGFYDIMFDIPPHPNVSFGKIKGLAAVPPAGFTGAPYWQGNSATGFGILVTDGTFIDLLLWTPGAIQANLQTTTDPFPGSWKQSTGTFTLSWAGLQFVPPLSGSPLLTGLEFDYTTSDIWASDTLGNVYQISGITLTLLNQCNALSWTSTAIPTPRTMIGNIVDRSVSRATNPCNGVYVTDGVEIYDLNATAGIPINDVGYSPGGQPTTPGYGASFFAAGTFLNGSGWNLQNFLISELGANVPNNPSQAIMGLWNGNVCAGDTCVLAFDSCFVPGGNALPPINYGTYQITPTYWLTPNATLINFPGPSAFVPIIPFTTIPPALINSTFYAQWAIIPGNCGTCAFFPGCQTGAIFLSDCLVIRVSDF